jgi:hypothetical protein
LSSKTAIKGTRSQVPDTEKVTTKNTKCLDQIGGGKPGPGRKPGIPNKANGLLKDAIIQATHGRWASRSAGDQRC